MIPLQHNSILFPVFPHPPIQNNLVHILLQFVNILIAVILSLPLEASLAQFYNQHCSILLCEQLIQIPQHVGTLLDDCISRRNDLRLALEQALALYFVII